jgi:hypothetical protein
MKVAGLMLCALLLPAPPGWLRQALAGSAPPQRTGWKRRCLLVFRHFLRVSSATCVHSCNIFVRNSTYLSDVAGRFCNSLILKDGFLPKK